MSQIVTRKSIQIVAFDGPRALQLHDVPATTPKAGEVSVDVTHSGANFVEVLFARGIVPLELPWTPGIEAAGTIRELGAGVTAPAPGTRVAALTINNGGGYGGIAYTNHHLVAPIPENMELDVASALPANTTTAMIALERAANLSPDESVLVHAGVGGVGSQFGQVARHYGVGHVAAVVGTPEKRKIAIDLGYDEAYLRSELDSVPKGRFDVVVDPVGGASRAASLGYLRLGGRLLVIGNASQAPPTQIDCTQLWLEGKAVVGFNLGAVAFNEPERVGTYLRRAVDLVAAGVVKVLISGTEPLERAGAVLEQIERGETSGKIVLVH